jgi:NADH-quinone oxidoreductase subunit G
MPLGFKTGAGVIFGNSGGVSEAVLRYVTERLAGEKREHYQFTSVRGEAGIREKTLTIADKEFSFAIVSGLGNARKVIERIRSGTAHYDLVEVMACPGGCINGAGQPVSNKPDVRQKRTKGIYENDRMLELHKSQENPYVRELYGTFLGEVGGHKAHQLLHTGYRSRKRIMDEDVPLSAAGGNGNLEVNVCFGTSCFLKGSQKLLHGILDHLRVKNLDDLVNVTASFCFERCDRGPTVRIGSQVIEKCTLDTAVRAIERHAASRVPLETGSVSGRKDESYIGPRS